MSVVLIAGRTTVNNSIDPAKYLEVPQAPKNYKDPAKIAAYVEKASMEQMSMLGNVVVFGGLQQLATQEDDRVTDIGFDNFHDTKAIRDAIDRIADASVVVGFEAKRLCRILVTQAAMTGVTDKLHRLHTMPKLDIFEEYTRESDRRLLSRPSFVSLVTGNDIQGDVTLLPLSRQLLLLRELCKRYGIYSAY